MDAGGVTPPAPAARLLSSPAVVVTTEGDTDDVCDPVAATEVDTDAVSVTCCTCVAGPGLELEGSTLEATAVLLEENVNPNDTDAEMLPLTDAVTEGVFDELGEAPMLRVCVALGVGVAEKHKPSRGWHPTLQNTGSVAFMLQNPNCTRSMTCVV